MEYRISIIFETDDEQVVNDLLTTLETVTPYMADNVIVTVSEGN